MTDEHDVASYLPELERQVFAALRDAGLMSVNDAVGRLAAENRPLAYTTVMTVLTRLWHKGYLRRRRQGRAYLYEAQADGEIADELGGRVAREAIAKFGTPAVTGFVRTLSPAQRALVARLLQEQAPGEEREP